MNATHYRCNILMTIKCILFFKNYTLEKLEPWMQENWKGLADMYEIYGERCLFDELQHSDFWKIATQNANIWDLNDIFWDSYRFCARDIYAIFQEALMFIHIECTVCSEFFEKKKLYHTNKTRLWPDEYAFCHKCQSRIQRLPIITVSEKNVECAVCLDYFFVGDCAKCLSCNHLYHAKCIKPWIEKNYSCPNCRKSIDVIL